MKVAELEQALLERYPLTDAESWDHVGLSVGDPAASVTGVSCALDATEANVRAAAERGDNVLLTHHPVYIKAPDCFAPASAGRPQASSALYTAARLGVSIISLHTNLDRSLEARQCLSQTLRLVALSSLEHPEDSSATGLGAICEIGPHGSSHELSLLGLARRCAQLAHDPLCSAVSTLTCPQGRKNPREKNLSPSGEGLVSAPRVWGEPDKVCRRVAILGGSLGDFGELAIAAGCDAIVTGEAGYHVAQDLAIRGLGVILMGHDRSEEPFVNILMESAIDAGLDPALAHTILNPRQWWTVTEGDYS